MWWCLGSASFRQPCSCKSPYSIRQLCLVQAFDETSLDCTKPLSASFLQQGDRVTPKYTIKTYQGVVEDTSDYKSALSDLLLALQSDSGIPSTSGMFAFQPLQLVEVCVCDTSLRE